MRRAVALLTLLLGYAVLSCQQVSLRTSADDLGRHIRDGELILAGHAAEILHRNFYSYTNPDSVFLNHHWLMTVLFYWLWKYTGMVGLNLVYVLLGAAAFLCCLRIAARESSPSTAAAIAALCLPLLAVRAGIRPEIFSTVMLWAFFTLLWGIHRAEIRPGWIWALPCLEVLWVNLHPGFILGPILIGSFLLASLKVPSPARRAPLAIVFVLSIAAGLANPNGVRGLLFPFTVSRNYGIEIRENLSVFRVADSWLSGMIEVTLAIVVLGYWIAWRRGATIEWPLMLFSLSLGVMSLAFYRIYVFFGPFAFLCTCVNLRAIGAAKKSRGFQLNAMLLAGIWALALIDGAVFMNSRWDTFGLEQTPDDAAMAQFLETNAVRGRVFNEYSTGGYLIFYFPDRRVYVDSRPEAYPAAFLRDEYTRPLKEESAWHDVVAKYDFDFICIGRMSQSEGNFVLRRIKDPEWAIVSGGSEVILVRRKPQFADLIARREIHFR
jgi:hypothetical protein